MPADKNWLYGPHRYPLHNSPAQHQIEVNLVSLKLQFSEVDITYDDTEIIMAIDGQFLPCHFNDGFCKPTTKSP